MDSIQSLLNLLYIFVVDYVVNGPTGRSKEVFTQLREAYKNADQTYKDLLEPELSDAMRAAGQNPESKVIAYMALGNIIKTVIPQINKDRAITAEQLDLFKALGLYMRSDSESALKKIIRFAHTATRNPWISKQLAREHGQQDASKLRAIVRKMTGTSAHKLTIEQAAEARTKFPDLYKEYLALAREYNQVVKDAIMSVVRQSGQHTVPMKDVEAYLKRNKIDSTLPTGFTGNIDDIGRFYTTKGEPIEGVPNSTTFPKVIMNRNYGKPNGGNWVFMAVRQDGTAGPYFYLSTFKREQAAKKFVAAKDLSAVLDKMRAKWFTHVKRFDITKPNDVAAVILEILYQFSARVGSVGNSAAGTPTFGISTLLAKHAYPQSNGNIILRYKGKDGVNTKHVIDARDREQKYLAAAMHVLLADKKPSERIFTYDKGNTTPAVSATMVNAYFRQLGAPSGVGVHKLRAVKGSKIFKELMESQLKKRTQPTTDKEALDTIKAMASQVGKVLNHVRRSATGEQTVTPTTALANYIDPVLQSQVYDAWDIRYPKYLEKLLSM